MHNTSSTVILLLENGIHCVAKGIGITQALYAELIFNTSMFGYEEIVTDQSYAGQAIVFTMPHIGAVGCNPNDMESVSISPYFIVVRALEEYPSNYRATQSFTSFLQKHSLPAVYDVDTRYITTILREEGALKAVAIPVENEEEFLEQKEQWLSTLYKEKPLQSASALAISVKEISPWHGGVLDIATERFIAPPSKVTIVVYDFGIKQSIVRILTSLGAECICVPKTTPAETVLAMNPHGICFSNGAGDPEDYADAIQSARIFLQKTIPLMGICLGHQIFGLALGAKTIKMKFGHHGGNHPVKHCRTNKVYITSQNHGFAVDATTLPPNATVTHISLFDGSLQGFSLEEPPLFAFQGHPEASPGPHDMEVFFTEYMNTVYATAGIR